MFSNLWEIIKHEKIGIVMMQEISKSKRRAATRLRVAARRWLVQCEALHVFEISNLNQEVK